MIDIEKVRNDISGYGEKIFLNSAGASLVPSQVTEAMITYLTEEAKFGGYQTAPLFQTQIDDFYTQTAILINTTPNNIAFTYNATDGFNKAVMSIPFEKGDVVLLSDDDYVSNYLTFMSLQNRVGIKIERISNLPNGDLDLEDAEAKIIKLSPKLVSITHVPTNSGKIQPVEEIGELCQKYGIWYIVDACQSIGQMVVDVAKIKCDFLSVTGRKFLRGPRGTGFLYVSDKVLNSGLHPIALDMRGGIWDTESSYQLVEDAKRFELWELAQASVIGLGEAIKYLNQIGPHHIQAHNKILCDALKANLALLPDIRITEDGNQSASIVTFTSRSRSLEDIKKCLDQNNVSYSVGFRHFALIDFNKKDVDWVIRFSPHYFNSLDEIERVVSFLR